MDDQRIGAFLEDLASDSPAPGGGAAAALHVALGAALVGMVCELTLGRPRYADAHERVRVARDRATALRREALDLAERDAAAFGAVAAAYRLPKATPEEQAARTGAVQAALQDAAAPPLATVEAAAEVIRLAEGILEGSNPNVRSDVAVAAMSGRAGLDAGALNVRVNLALLHDEAVVAAAEARLAAVAGPARDLADHVVATVQRSVERVAD